MAHGPHIPVMRNDDELDYDADKLSADEALVADSFWDKLRRTLGQIPFVEDALAAYYCATDRSTPLYVKAVLMGALAYFIIPTDVIPDFIAGIGYTDDASVLAAAIAAVRSHMRAEHFDAARAFLKKDDDGGLADAGQKKTDPKKISLKKNDDD